MVRAFRLLLLVLVATVGLWSAWPQPAAASLHTYRERPGQVTVRSRQSFRDNVDRAWQAIAFKRTQNNNLQGIYVRLVGFPGAVQIDRQQPVQVVSLIGQNWQLEWAIDAQTQALPENVGQYNLQPLLRDLDNALPLEIQIPLKDGDPAIVAIAPYGIEEWLQVQQTDELPAPMTSSLGKESQ